MNAVDGAGMASRRVAVLVEPRMLADMISMLLVERGVEVVAVDDDPIDVVVVNQALLSEVRTGSTSVTVVLPDDGTTPSSTGSSTMDLTQLLNAVEDRASG